MLFNYPPGSARALLAGTLPFGTALLGLPEGSLHGGCWCLDTLLAWLLLILGFLRVVGLRFLVGRFTGLVVLDQDGKNSTKQKKPLHTSRVSYSISATGVEVIASCGAFIVSFPDRKRRRGDQDDGTSVQAQIRTGVG